MHALVSSILLRSGGLNEFGKDTQADPPDRQPGRDERTGRVSFDCGADMIGRTHGGFRFTWMSAPRAGPSGGNEAMSTRPRSASRCSRPLLQAQRFSVKIFVPAGDPEGLHVIEKSKWTGYCFSPFALCRGAPPGGTQPHWRVCPLGTRPIRATATRLHGFACRRPSSCSRRWWSMNADDLPPEKLMMAGRRWSP